MVKVLFVCLGNICRSPLAEALFKKAVEDRGLTDQIYCDSAATSTYEIGNRPDRRTCANAESHGLKLDHRAKQLRKSDFTDFDYIIGMDDSNFDNIHAMSHRFSGSYPSHEQVFLLRKFDPFVEVSRGIPSLPDPYYEPDEAFEEVYQIAKRSTEKLLDWIIKKHHLE
ncbi:protein tyrosine phosphatase [Siphonobacter sp. SORGH_AS_0500]|uniref:low molecular weight protein-tyrosine-phosphatase n=1 Tax=Siphonobacter sp. SORGH_AS_0500 TaxID=1864824 RepID=UPI000CC58190|nr:low molecular weight protein-tyrosine-phosphatase [Siphonobacter sp. SORGH_AS_0500]PKK35721.1 protein tyrosine phosphatase [Siphonobacter sp. SORGH_AS_0500]